MKKKWSDGKYELLLVAVLSIFLVPKETHHPSLYSRTVYSLRVFNINKTKSIGVSEANSSCIWFLNGGIIDSY